MSAKPAAAAANSSETDASAMQTASHSTGQNGGRLKWLPSRPESAQTESTVNTTQYKTSSSLRRPLRTAQNQTPKLGEELSSEIPAEPKPQDSASEPKPGAPSALETPYVAPGGLAPSSPAKPSTSDAKQPSLEQQYAPQLREFKESCPSPKDLKPIRELTTNITPSEGELPHDCPLGNATFKARVFAPITYTWTASGLCHKPLYFEDVQLERYGHMAGPWVQPFASGAHFFLTIPILPYKMGLETPNECMYSLGYYRPGDCAPYLFDPLPLSVRGALFEAGAWVGAVAIFP